MPTQLQFDLQTLGKAAKRAARQLETTDTDKKNAALLAIANIIQDRSAEILATNQQDIQNAKTASLEPAFIDRLALDQKRLDGIIQGLHAIAALDDPVGRVLDQWQVESGLSIQRVAIPLGTLGVIYESRPNVTVDAAALCLKSGNSVILRGGSECEQTNRIFVRCLQDGLTAAGLPDACIQYVPTQDRAAVSALLTLDEYIDVIIPRGGKSLIQRIAKESRIPVLKHLDGLCHTYIHRDAELSMATDIVINAKLRRTGICGATETLLIDRDIAADFLPAIITALQAQHCEIRGDKLVQQLGLSTLPAIELDWQTEYLAPILSIKTVENLDDAIAHIHRYSSDHTEAIITADPLAAREFMRRVNSAIVMHNCSTQFADGGEFGMGAEIGISTGKLHARGPVGVQQLTTFKYQVSGRGQCRAS